MEQSEEKTRRPRRPKITLQRDILDAVGVLVTEGGFSSINLSSISQKANVDINAILRNFHSLDRLLDRYAQIFDYWYDDVVRGYENAPEDPELYYNQLLKNITESLYKDKNMRHLLVWEMTEEGDTTRRVAFNREHAYSKAINPFQEIFKGTEIDIEVLTALITGGINYLLSRRKKSTYLGIDFCTPRGKERLLNAIPSIVKLIFSSLQQQQEMLTAAKNLKAKGISAEVIAECLGLSKDQVESV